MYISIVSMDWRIPIFLCKQYKIIYFSVFKCTHRFSSYVEGVSTKSLEGQGGDLGFIIYKFPTYPIPFLEVLMGLITPLNISLCEVL